MLLIGSQALKAHGFDLNRPLHDWDLLASDDEFVGIDSKYKECRVKETPSGVMYDIDGQIIEVKPERLFTETDDILYHLKSSDGVESTPIGPANVPRMQYLYDMKLATSKCIPHWKHEYDIQFFEKHINNLREDTLFFNKRLKETQERVAKQDQSKFQFFHKNALKEQKIATIPEYIEHDYLHVIIADLLDLSIPTYQRFVTGATEITDECWNKLTHQQKIDAMVEESLVLALERWFIPQMIENGINYRLHDMFFNNNEAMPTYKLLYHCCVKGLIGEKEYIVNFARENFNVIEQHWIDAKEKIRKKGFPKHFLDKIFVLRDKYKQGEKIGLHHKENIMK